MTAWRVVQDAFWDSAAVIPYVEPGFLLAKAAAAAAAAKPSVRALVLMKHGLITWGPTARESYLLHLDLVTQAENIAAARARCGVTVTVPDTAASLAWERLAEIGPVLRGQLARPTGEADRPWDRVILQPIVTDGVLALLAREGAKDALVTPPLTTDHLIRTKSLPLWIDAPAWRDEAALRAQCARRDRGVPDVVRRLCRTSPRRDAGRPGRVRPDAAGCAGAGSRRDLRRTERPRGERLPGTSRRRRSR